MTERDPLSMSTDSTAKGDLYADTVEGGPISQVHIGDPVIDSTGKELGKVKFVKMGDPNAATVEGQLEYGDNYDIRDLPLQAQGQLLSVGYIHIDISLARDRFAGAGQIDRVQDAKVHLNVPEEALISTDDS